MPDEEPRGLLLCRWSGWKVSHRTPAAARAALARARETADERRQRKLPRRIYGPCGWCGGWHVTSQTRNQWLMWPGNRRRN